MVLAGLFFGMLVVPRSSAAQLEVDQLEIVLRAEASGASGSLSVRNVGAQATTARLLIKDWDRAVDGGNRWHDAGTVTGSCHPQIEVFPTTLRLEPNQVQSIRVTYSGGPRQTLCWSAVVVEEAPQPASNSGRGAQLTVVLEHAIKVYVEPADARAGLELVDVDVARHTPVGNESRADTLAYDVTAIVTNPGRAQARVKASIEYRTLSDSMVARTAIGEFPVLPGARRSVRSRVPVLPPGRYVVLVVFDYGGAELVAGRLDLDLAR
jgi:P pilus assembly chaperone PapD